MKVLIAVAALMAATPALAHQSSTANAPTATKPKPKPVTTSPHSGGTDAYGCHTDHSTGVYHCHNPK